MTERVDMDPLHLRGSATSPLALGEATVRSGSNTSLNTVCLTVEMGEILGPIGPNGAGQTTFL
jgi:ABC-type branched-subunit amino acid transport system ATPase component